MSAASWARLPHPPGDPDVERVVRVEIEERHATAREPDGAWQHERAASLRVEASHLERLLDGS